MTNLCNRSYVNELLEKYSLSPKKAFGQNFLINSDVPMKIASLSSSFALHGKPSAVLEIGPGVGALTQYLCTEYDKVVAVEIDRGLIPLLGEALSEYDNVTVVEGDFMKLDLPKFIDEHFSDIISQGGSIGVCANLPYYITTPVIMKLLESFPDSSELPFASIVVMVQLEVARRLSAAAGSPDYGAISASIALRASASNLLDVSAGNFYPIPKVASAVVGIIPHGGITEIYEDAPDDIAQFTSEVVDVISLAFGQRRKTFLNALSGKYPKDKTASVLEELNIRTDIRGEMLSARDFCMITDKLRQKL